MNAARARGRLVMEAWRFTSRGREASALDRLRLRGAAETALLARRDAPPLFDELCAAAFACAAAETPLTDDHISALEAALAGAARALRAKVPPAEGAPRPKLYYLEGQYA